MNKLDYNNYLNSTQWKQKRLEVFNKQGKCCRVCGSTKNLNIHHRKYNYKGKSILNKELNQNLLVICGDCHTLWHKINGLKHIPFPTLRNLLNNGIPKIEAFKHPYTKVKNFPKICKESIAV